MFFIFLICLFTLVGQMPSMIDCLPMSIDNSTKTPPASNSLYQYPFCFPIDPNSKKQPPVNEQEFMECMQAKINNISRLDNQSRAVLDKIWKMEIDEQKHVFNKTLEEAQQKELLNELFDVQDMDKDGYLTVEEISQFQMHCMNPYYLEKYMKMKYPPNMDQVGIAFAYAWTYGDDLEKAKTGFDKDAAKFVQAEDKNGDGKLSRDELKRFSRK